jgi:hypothetical protein
MFGANCGSILHRDKHYIQIDWNKILHDPRHLRVPSGVFKMIFKLTVRSAQTVNLSWIKISNVSNRSKTSFHLRHVTLECHSVRPKSFLRPWYTWCKSCTYLALKLTLSPNGWKWSTTWCTQSNFLSLWYVWCKSCTYHAPKLTLSPKGPKGDSTWPTSPRSSNGCVQNGLWSYGTFGANCGPISHRYKHYFQTDRNEILQDPHHLGVPTGASKMISEPTVRLAQTVPLSWIKISTISKRTETSFHLSLVTQEYHPVHPKQFLSLWYVWRKPCTYHAPKLTLSPKGPKGDCTWPTSSRSSNECFQNGFWGYGTFGTNYGPILHRDKHYIQIDRNKILHDPRHLGVPSRASKMIFELTVRSAQTMHLSWIKISTVSNRSKTSFHLSHVTLECHSVRPKRFLRPWYTWCKPCTYLALKLTLSPNEQKRASIWASSPKSTTWWIQSNFLSLWYVQRKLCTYHAPKLTLSPKGPKGDSTWPTSPRSSNGCVQNGLWSYGTFIANYGPILHRYKHYFQTDQNKILQDPHHLGVPTGASKMISEPTVRLAQTVPLSWIKISTISKRTETSLHLSLVTQEYHPVHPKQFLGLWYVWRKPCTYHAPKLTLYPKGPKGDSTWPRSTRCSIRCVQNDF